MHLLEGTEENHEKPQDKWYPGADLNEVSLKYEADVLSNLCDTLKNPFTSAGD
jgi:hypothetical protein